MAADLTNTVIDKLILELPLHFNKAYQTPANNPLYLKSVVRYPLQDDPTIRSFYIAVGPDLTMEKDNRHWRSPVDALRRGMIGLHQHHPELEIGGGYKMINFFLLKGWLPVHSSKEKAYANGGLALRRLEQCFGKLARTDFFYGITTDDGMESTAAGYPQVFNLDGGHFDLVGGENTWYPQLSMRFHLFSEISRDYWGDPH